MSYKITVLQLMVARSALGTLQGAKLPYADSYRIARFMRPLVGCDGPEAPHNVIFQKFQDENKRPPTLDDLPEVLRSEIEVPGELLPLSLLQKAAEALGGISAADLMALAPFLEEGDG